MTSNSTIETGLDYSVKRPAMIAQRHWCPTCDAQPGESCRLGGFSQGYSHVARHRVAQRALWQTELREIAQAL